MPAAEAYSRASFRQRHAPGAVETTAAALDMWADTLSKGREPTISVMGLRDMAKVVRAAATLSQPEAPNSAVMVSRNEVVRICLNAAKSRRDQAASDGTPDQKRRWIAGAIQAGILADQVKALAALSQPEAHPDDLAVDRFANAMKAKLAKKRADGRGGWEDPDCSEAILSRLLREHVEKGDPLDVGNFAMMLHQRGERIAQPEAQEPVMWRWKPKGWPAWIYDPGLDWLERHREEIDAEPLYTTPPAAQVTVAEAARVLLADPTAILTLCRSYDREDSAQRGEPDPHDKQFEDGDDFSNWLADRIGCAEAALRAVAGEGRV